MNQATMHKVQIIILYALRHTKTARFSDLMRLTGLDSDTFKFHVKKLVKLGYLEKTSIGQYALTAAGKEFANNLDEPKRFVQKQPKLSVLLVVPKPNSNSQYLFQQRKRSPYYDFWSCIGGPVQWGEEFEETAIHELKKQTGLTADFRVRSFYHKRDYIDDFNDLLEDKLFVVLEATNVKGQLDNIWHGGFNAWMTVEEFKQQGKHFDSVYEAIEHLQKGIAYASRTAYYNPEEY